MGTRWPLQLVRRFGQYRANRDRTVGPVTVPQAKPVDPHAYLGPVEPARTTRQRILSALNRWWPLVLGIAAGAAANRWNLWLYVVGLTVIWLGVTVVVGRYGRSRRAT